jgi:glycosyltransferase involved in cell wall biosynthesis
MTPRPINESTPCIFFATRPIQPPWDEASKNMVYQIARRMAGFRFILLTPLHQQKLLDQPGVSEKNIYPRAIGRQLTLAQKLAFLAAFVFSKADLYHFYFTPEIYSSRIFKFFKKFKKGIYLQTFATPVADETLIPELAFGDWIIAQSDHSLSKLQQQGIRNCARIYPAVDTDVFKPAPDPAPLRARLGLEPHHKVVLYAGNFYLGCNEDLTATILHITRENPAAVFILACRCDGAADREERRRMEEIFGKENLGNRALFLEKVDCMAELIALCDIHLFPPRIMVKKADIPMVLLETLAMAKPVVITDIAPLNELFKEDVGEKIPPGDPGRLIEAVRRLLADPELRRKKGETGRRMVVREFALHRYIEQYRNLYETLLAEHKR